MATWDYSKGKGPANWAEDFPVAAGKRQSPIDIKVNDAKYDQALADKPLKMKYSAQNSKSLGNSGRSFVVDTAVQKSSGTKESVAPNTLEGGPLPNKFEMAQWHAHWGAKDGRGSEHTLDGNAYGAEIHLVHWNSVKYETFGQAAQEGDGLAVLGIFVKVGKEHKELKQITDGLAKIQHSGKNLPLTEGFNPEGLLPKDTTKYWTYDGSLTTPPLLESVLWIVFQEPIEISEGQVGAFRALLSYAEDQQGTSDEFDGKIIDNFRPPLPLGDRLLRASFKKGAAS